MGTVIGGVHDGLKSIAVDFFHSIRDDLLFPPRPTTFEEFLRSKVKDQYSMIRSRDGKISYLLWANPGKGSRLPRFTTTPRP